MPADKANSLTGWVVICVRVGRTVGLGVNRANFRVSNPAASVNRARQIPGFRQKLFSCSACFHFVNFFQLLFNALPFQRRQIIDEQLAVQMIQFVLDANGQQIAAAQLERLAVFINAFTMICSAR